MRNVPNQVPKIKITEPPNVIRIGTRSIETTSHRRFFTDGADLDDTQGNDIWMCTCFEEKD